MKLSQPNNYLAVSHACAYLAMIFDGKLSLYIGSRFSVAQYQSARPRLLPKEQKCPNSPPFFSP